MTIVEEFSEEKCTVKISGHIDVVTVDDVQEAMLRAFRKSNNVTLEMTDVTYISSAGLRMILIGLKTANSKHGSFVIKGASKDLHKVLAISGIEKLLTFEE